MPFLVVCSALEQKALDDQENPISAIAADKFWDVQKPMAIISQEHKRQSVIMSKEVRDSLSAAPGPVKACPGLRVVK